MARVAARVEIDASPEQTWDAAVDWPQQRKWVLASDVVATSGAGQGVHATVEARTGIGRLALTDPMEIVEWDPPRLLVLRHVGPFVRGDARYEISALPGGRSALEWSEELESPGPLLRGLYAIGVPLFGVMIRISLHRFARWVPRRTTPPA